MRILLFNICMSQRFLYKSSTYPGAFERSSIRMSPGKSCYSFSNALISCDTFQPVVNDTRKRLH